MQFCSECGSADLSTPTAPASFLYRASGFVLYLFAGLTIAAFAAAAALSLFYRIDWPLLAPTLIQLGVVVGFLYWTTTLLPGPIRRLGKAAGRRVWRSSNGKRTRGR